MRRSNTETLGEVIQRLLKAYGLEQKLNESKIYDAWPEVVGEAIAQRTKRLAIVNRVLFVYLNSSVVKAELLRIKESLPQVLNRKVGLDLIDEVVIR
jgi:predicted nucleic acid-binding Zn ribbon protein